MVKYLPKIYGYTFNLLIDDYINLKTGKKKKSTKWYQQNKKVDFGQNCESVAANAIIFGIFNYIA